MIKIVLPQRLKAVYNMVPKCEFAVDIGTDHAYIPILLTENNKAKKSVAADIVEGPLEIAKSNILSHNLQDKIETILSNGLSCVPFADCYIIAGMGGKLICDILSAGEEKAKNAESLILQPMTGQYELRKFLHSNGYKIDDEDIAVEGKRVYNIIKASKGEEKYDEESFYYLGKCNIEKNNPYLHNFIETKVNSINKRTQNMKNSVNEEIITERKELLVLKEALLKYDNR